MEDRGIVDVDECGGVFGEEVEDAFVPTFESIFLPSNAGAVP